MGKFYSYDLCKDWAKCQSAPMQAFTVESPKAPDLRPAATIWMRDEMKIRGRSMERDMKESRDRA